MNRRAWKTKGIVLLSVMLVTASSLAMEVAPTESPLERIVADLEERLRVAPDDSLAQYNLGRAHAFAFALERSSLWAADERPVYLAPVVDRGVLVKDLEDQLLLDERQQKHGKRDVPPVPTQTELLAHLAAGVLHLRRACEIEEKGVSWANPKHLTFAWLLETGAHLADRVDTPTLLDVHLDNLPSGDVGAQIQRWIGDLGSSDEALATAAREALSTRDHLELALPLLWPQRCSSSARRMKAVVGLLERYWLERAIEEYWQTFELAVAEHIANNEVSVRRGKELGSLVSYEAIASYRRLVQQRGVRGPEETARLAKASEQCEQLEALPHSVWVTPLLLSLDADHPGPRRSFRSRR